MSVSVHTRPCSTVCVVYERPTAACVDLRMMKTVVLFSMEHYIVLYCTCCPVCSQWLPAVNLCLIVVNKWHTDMLLPCRLYTCSLRWGKVSKSADSKSEEDGLVIACTCIPSTPYSRVTLSRMLLSLIWMCVCL